MRFSASVDDYIAAQWADGRFTSPRTDDNYRYTLGLHAQDVNNRDPSSTNREDVKRTLARWANPNTRSLHRSHLVSFYDWTLEEGLRKDNPARQTRRPKTREAEVYRLTREEVRALRDAALGIRETRTIEIGLLAGLRASELCGLQGRHFRREGWIWVSSDIGKGNRERWVPVLPELVPTWEQIAQNVGDEQYVIPKLQHRFVVTGKQVPLLFYDEPTAYPALYDLVRRVGKRARIKATIHPHLLRHAFGDFVARHADMRVAQFVLGHSRIGTTERYTSKPTLEEISAALEGFGYTPSAESPLRPLRAPVTSLAPESHMNHWERVLQRLWASQSLRTAAKEMGS